MDSKIVSAIKLKYQPVAMIFTEQKPQDAKQFAEGKWGCLMWLFAAAAKGRAAVVDRQTFGCLGGGVGFGFGNQYDNWPGGKENFYHFLSNGIKNSESGRAIMDQVKPLMRQESYENLVHGEGYMKSPEQVKKFVECMPITEIPTPYLALKPLADVDPAREKPEVVVMLADPDQLSALVVLANYARSDNENVIIPWCAGCQSIGIYAFKEAKSEKPRGVVGLLDISARASLRGQIDPNLLTFAAPYSLFQEMENNVAGSFLERENGPWRKILEAREP